MKDTINGIFGETFRKDIDFENKCVNENRCEKYDKTVVEYWYKNSLCSIAKSLRDEGIDDENNVEDMNLMLSHLGALLLSKSKRTMNKLVFARDCCKKIELFLQTLIHCAYKNFLVNSVAKKITTKKKWVKKNYYGEGGEFFGLFLAPEVEYCLTSNKYELLEEKKSFKSFQDAKKLLDLK